MSVFARTLVTLGSVGAALAGGFERPGESCPGGELSASRAADGTVALAYVPACNAPDHAVVWGRGPLAAPPQWSGATCGLGATGSASVALPDPDPGSMLYFVVVGQDATWEGSFGRDSAGAERPEATGLAACERPRSLQASCVAVDFRRSDPGARSQSGFLHSISTANPPDERVAPLAPAQWRRHSFDYYDRITGFGARFSVVLSDMWGYPNATWGWPYEHWGAWDKWVRNRAIEFKGKAAVWDIWNEPDGSYFWAGTVAQYREMYRRTAAILREELGPDVLLAGPSLSWFNRSWINGFLGFCKAAGCEVNVLTWHELGGGITSIDDHLLDARASWVDGDYAPLRLSEIQVNEIIGPSDMHRPGAILGFFYYLEAGRSDGACKACWNESNGIANCDNDSLDGLLVPGTYATRSAWWAYKSYADGAGSRVRATTGDPGLVALAGRAIGGPDRAQVLLGSFDTGGAPASSPATAVLSGVSDLPFAGNGLVRVRVERIPNTGEAPLAAPLLVRETVESLVHGALLVRIDGFALNDAYLVTLSSAAR